MAAVAGGAAHSSGRALRAGLDVAHGTRHAAAIGVAITCSLLGLEGGLLGDEALEAGEAIGVEAALGDGLAHRAAGLLIVLAVPEPAVLHQVEHVGEGPLDALAGQPQAHGPHARRVDEPSLAGQRQQLGGDGGVATALVAGAHLGGGLHARAEQRVDERRLADAAGAEERQRAIRRGERPQLVDAVARRPLVTSTGTPSATCCSSRRAGSGSSTRSALVSTTTGSAPLS